MGYKMRHRALAKWVPFPLPRARLLEAQGHWGEGWEVTSKGLLQRELGRAVWGQCRPAWECRATPSLSAGKSIHSPKILNLASFQNTAKH